MGSWVRCGRMVALLLSLGVPVGVWAGNPAPGLDPETIDAYLAEQVKIRRLPGLAVALVEGDRVVLLRGYGSAGEGRPMTQRTQLYIGSCTKSFTALAVMQLVERGLVDLDAPVQRYLPEFEVADETASRAISVRHLLNQTSGLSESGDPQAHRSSASLKDATLSLRRARLTSPVGARFQYFNPNYRVLGYLIERVTGQAYGSYLHDHVVTPLGMQRTVADPSLAPHLAQGHADLFGWPVARPQGFEPGALSSGYLISTAEDLSHYLVALLNGGRYGDTTVVTEATLGELFAPPHGVDDSGATPPAAIAGLLGAPGGIEGGYGMGWLLAQGPDGRQAVFHGGSLERFRADILLLPRERRGLALLVNENGVLRPLLDPSPLWVGVAHLMLGRPGPPPPPVRWRVRVFVLLVAADLGIGLLRLGRLRRWRTGVLRRHRATSWALALIDALPPAAFLLLFPTLLGRMVGVDVTWPGFFDFLPDVAIWFLASAALSLTRGLAKVTMLVAGRTRRPE